MLQIAIVTGSTRPHRNNEAVAQWVLETAARHGGARYELVDIATFDLPLLDEEAPAGTGGAYQHEHTKAWSKKVDSFDAFVFVTPEYNHGLSGTLKNAVDFLFREWNNKAAGFVSYGMNGGIRSVEQLRGVMAALMIADVRAQVALSLITDFANMSSFKPAPMRDIELRALLDQLIAWGGALKTLRPPRSAQGD
jgi:NAD(P)H-dependent FMN reductase